MIMSHTLVQLLASCHDEVHIAAPHASAPVAERMTDVADVHWLNMQHGQLALTERWHTGRRFGSQGFSIAYVLPNSWKSALIPLFAGIQRRVGWQGESRYGLLTDRRTGADLYPLMVERYMALAHPDGELPQAPYPTPQLNVDPHNLEAQLERFHLSREPAVGICPGAEFGPTKQWPVTHYAELASQCQKSGRQVWLFGTAGDKAKCDEIALKVPEAFNLAGQTTLYDAIDLLSTCESIVCNDSGLMHVGCALGVKTVAVFGSTSPQFTPPLGRLSEVVEMALPCRPCFQRRCPLGHTRCLTEIVPDRVFERIVG